MLAVIIVRLLGIITDLNKRFGFGIDAKAWEEQVILTDQDDEIVSQKMVLLPYGTKLAEGVDPSTLPGAVMPPVLPSSEEPSSPNAPQMLSSFTRRRP